MSDQHGFYITIEVVLMGSFDAANEEAFELAERINDGLGCEAEIVVTETGENLFKGIPNGVYCEACQGNVFPGIIWPQEKDGDTSRSWVECCDTCSRYEDDEAAYKHVVEAYTDSNSIGDHGYGRPLQLEDYPVPDWRGYYVETT